MGKEIVIIENEFTEALIDGKRSGYAGGGKYEPHPFKPQTFVFQKRIGDFLYTDEYSGNILAPGIENMFFQDIPIWHMYYGGEGLYKEFLSRKKEIFDFLKKLLLKVEQKHPFRGPENDNIRKGDFIYSAVSTGDIRKFNGCERIYIRDEKVFEQIFIGGEILDYKYDIRWK